MKYRKERKFNVIVIAIFVAMLFPLNSLCETYYSKEVKEQYYKKEIDELIVSRPKDKLIRHKHYSSAFLERPYKSDTLFGDSKNKEVLVVNLEEMDCFTYLDYVHSLIHAENYYDFINQLKNTRYKDGIVSYKNRNHFFYDWSKNIENIKDVTNKLFEGQSTQVIKNLNLKDDGKLFLNGIEVRRVSISYLKPQFVNNENLRLFKSGDYIGIYSHLKGLDVSHVGILIEDEGTYLLRHASSSSSINKVIDVNFLEYIKNKPGIIIYRNNN